MDRATVDEINALWRKISDVERRQSSYTTSQTDSIKSDVSEDWNEKDLYKADQYVMRDNALWLCKIQNMNSRPYEGSPYWEKVNIAAEFNRLASLINDLKKEDK